MVNQITTSEQVKIIKIEMSSDTILQRFNNKPLILAGETGAHPIVAELSIYENITYPFLTGSMVMQDDHDLYRLVDLNGTEKITVEYQIADKSLPSIVKSFYIANLVSSTKTNDYTSILAFNLIEDIGYFDLVQPISRYYDGKGEDIIRDMINDALSKQVDLSLAKDSFQSAFRYIVPYVSAFTAAKTILEKMSTSMGLPYFLFATLGSDNITLTDLETILSEPPSNKGAPFTYSQGQTQLTDLKSQALSIHTYEGYNLEDTLKLAQNGAIGSRYININASTGEIVNTHIDMNAYIQILIDNGILNENTKSLLTNNGAFIVDPSGNNLNRLSDFDSKVVSDIGSTVYPNSGLNSFNGEERKEYNQLKNVKNYMLQLLQKNIYKIFVPGLVFMLNNKMTVGTQIAIEILKNSPEPQPGMGKDKLIDEKRSGNYIILAKRHIFDIVEEKHNVSLEISRISNAETIDQ
jgi:hypothetical protein